MRLSLRWLQEFVDLTDYSEETIIAKMIAAGFEVEEVIHLGQVQHLVVGEIISCIPHPDSDHLQITQTSIGDKVLQIVCGAKNCRAGLKVIVAPEGCVLPGGTIQICEKRGVLSQGMLCSLLELGVDKDLLDTDSTSHFGIEELPIHFQAGETDILSRLGYQDTILDLAIYANRPDCMAMFSLAKEVAAILNRPCRLPDYKGSAAGGAKTNLRVTIHTDACTHYLAKVIGKLEIKESPLWLKAHLRSQGIASINNVVDISNYVMLETGQPLHFFDLRSNPALDIEIRDDYSGEYVALDGNTYPIQPGTIMIMSENRPLAIAGIMGGESSKIQKDTTAILIESAAFDRASIRRSANRLGLQTEAAMRYAKGLDPLAQSKALDRAVQLLQEFAAATELQETVKAGDEHYTPRVVSETLSHLNALIGKSYTLEEVVDVLRRLDFAPEVEGETIHCHIPSYRSEDIRLREDLDEEIVRLTDFADLQASLPNLSTTIGRLSPRQKLRRVLRDDLTNKGFYETISYTLTDEKGIANSLLPIGESITLSSPLSDARKYLRTSLFSSLLNSLSYNLNHGNENVNLFEISQLYASERREERLGILLRGELSASRIRHEKVTADFYVLKGILYSLFQRLGFASGRIKTIANDVDTRLLHPYRSAVIQIDNQLVAIFGEIHPAYSDHKKLGRVVIGEIMIEKLLSLHSGAIKAKNVCRYPSISRDISITVPLTVSAEAIIKTARKAANALVSDISIFDIYCGEPIAKGQKSVSLAVKFESADHTLHQEEIAPVYDKIVQELNKQYGALVRS